MSELRVYSLHYCHSRTTNQKVEAAGSYYKMIWKCCFVIQNITNQTIWPN